MSGFGCVCLVPPVVGIDTVRAAVAAGATALLDLAVEPERRLAEAFLDELTVDWPGGHIGVRIRPDQLPLLEDIGSHPHLVVLSHWRPETLEASICAMATPGRLIWVEIRSGDEITTVDPELPIDGWLGRGLECGGLSGRESAFVLAQRLSQQQRPFWIQGAIGPHAAAACKLAGADGVVLDDALLLLREAATPLRWRTDLAALRPQDTRVIGAEWADPRRVAMRPSLAGSQALASTASELSMADGAIDHSPDWRDVADRSIGWGDADVRAWPLGQSAGRIAGLAERYGSVGRLVRAVLHAADTAATIAADAAVLAPGAPLAESHGTRYPLVQGPMTRVSDGAEFAAAVADAGALPLLALAMMGHTETADLLAESAARLGELPWGVGLLGYLDPAVLEPQLAHVIAIQPPFALIAGGRPDQAARLEAAGIATYIHAPTPDLLRMFLGQGARRFVFEGAECGGHVGPLTSFALWQAMVDVLLDFTTAPDSDPVHILFAGGIHDALSAAMLGVLIAPLSGRRIACGALMGSAYLFTTDAVDSGAITSSFQAEALECRATTLIETRPGHLIRVAPTAFVTQFNSQAKAMRSHARSAADRSGALEALATGRLRIASKGLAREGDQLIEVDVARRRSDGLYMMGDVAALRDSTQSCAALHADVSIGSGELLRSHAAPSGSGSTSPSTEAQTAPAESVAIIGISCMVPGAHDADTLWRRLLDGESAITEIPARRWDYRVYYDPGAVRGDAISAKWGGFIDPVPFDPLRYGIPPNALSSISHAQLLALEGTSRALEDAGLGDLRNDPGLRERTAAIFGVASTGDLEMMYKLRSGSPLVSPLDDTAKDRLPEWTEESYPGILLNIVAGRVANRFDLGGPNFTVDAACASSLTALDLAVRELQSGRSDLALAGAVEAELSPHAYVAFTNTGALSPTGRARVFDRDADGIVLGEGVVVLALKRLADAQRDGDRIYATIRAIAGSSDGRGGGITAPRSAGQVRAVERAHAAAGTRVADLGLYEAHGTGTKVGDRTELDTLTAALHHDGAAPASCVVGSAKSLLGHTRAAAGMVGVVKCALALRHRVLPPHFGVEDPLDALAVEDAPIRLLDRPLPWLAAGGTPRLAGVSAFGFGGVNFHAVLQEYPGRSAEGARQWPVELIVLAADDHDGLLHEMDRLDAAADRVGAGVTLPAIAASSVLAAGDTGNARIAIVAPSAPELKRLLAGVRQHLASGAPLPPGVTCCLTPASGDLAVLFPGQGAQAPGMGAELALYFPQVRAALAATDMVDTIMPGAAFGKEEIVERARALADTRVAQPAIAALACGMLDLARYLGVSASRIAGHSFGEFVALHAAGVLTRRTLHELASMRGRLMAEHGPGDGAMAMVAMGSDDLMTAIGETGGVWIANLNAPAQTVLSGERRHLEPVLKRLESTGTVVRRLAVSSAFHSPLMQPIRAPFSEFIESIEEISAPAIPVHGNRDGLAYPVDALAIRTRMIDHLQERVDFAAQVNAMWDAGARTFLEIGPGSVLTGLVDRILHDRPHRAISSDGGLRRWLAAMGQLWAQGTAVDLTRLFENREIDLVDLGQLPHPAPDPGWLLDGGSVCRVGEVPKMGKAPFRDRWTAADVASQTFDDPVASTYAEYQQTMRAFLEQQERILERMLGETPASVEAGDRPAAIPAPKPDAHPERAELELAVVSGGMPDRDSLLRMLVAIVSDRTGYSSATVRPDLDLEAELGVNSIQRIEVVGQLLTDLPPGIAGQLEERFDDFVGARSLHDLTDAILDGVPASTRSHIAFVPDGPPGCPRFTMVPVERAVPAGAAVALPGLCLVTGGLGDLAELTADALRRHGVPAAIVSEEQLLDRGKLTVRVQALRLVHGPVRAVVHLAGMDRPVAESLDLDTWRAATSAVTKGLFSLLQALEPELESDDSPLRLVSPSRLLDATAAGQPPMANPLGGGAHGLLHSLAREYPHVFAKTLDMDGSLPTSDLVTQIVTETLVPGGGAEIVYRDGLRFLMTPQPTPLQPGGAPRMWRPQAGWVVLATGGARGITAEICRAVAGKDVRFVLVVRPGSDGDPTVARQHQVTIADLRAAGSEVEYHAVDVRSEADFGGLIADVYARHGRIDAVLHGAGLIEDQRFCAKASDSFARVHDTKTDSTVILATRLQPSSLKWMVLFGSVSGRFGNPGQSDYAAGNETMARLGRSMNRAWPEARVVTIDWGPWQGAGMASVGMTSKLKAAGIEPISIEAGRRFVVDELTWGPDTDSEVIAGRGPWAVEPDATLAMIFEHSFRILRRVDEPSPLGSAI